MKKQSLHTQLRLRRTLKITCIKSILNPSVRTEGVSAMDSSIRILLTVPRFCIGTRLLCIQVVKDFECSADLIRKTKGYAALESEFHYAEKLDALSHVVNYLLDPDSEVSESRFLDLIAELETEI